jgi:hypothetical protein
MPQFLDEFDSPSAHHTSLFFRPDEIYRVGTVHGVIKPLKKKVRAMTVGESVML